MIFRSSILLFLFLSFFNASFAQGNYENLQKQIDKILKYEFDSDQTLPDGYSIAIIDGDSSWIFTYGHLPNSERPLNEESIFELSGLSKIICNTYILHLTKDSLFDIQQNVLSQLLKDVTIEDLINHKTGLPKFIKKFQTQPLDPLAPIASDDLIAELNNIRIKRNKKFQYSHHNYGVLQWFLEDYYSENIHSQIKRWLSSHDISSYHLTVNLNSLTPGVSRIGESSNPSTFDGYWASLGMHSDILFMKEFVQKLSIPLHRYRIESNTRKISKTFIDRHTYFIDGWYGLKLDKKRYIYSHAGRNKRHKVSVQMLPETSTAVIIFSNSEIGTYDLSLHILRMLNSNWKRK